MTQDEIVSLAHGLMAEHKLIGWSVRFDSHKRRFGVCCYREKYIGVSWPVARINSDAEVMNVIRHEIAHAMTPGADHGPMWKLAAMVTGARPEACVNAASIQFRAAGKGNAGAGESVTATGHLWRVPDIVAAYAGHLDHLRGYMRRWQRELLADVTCEACGDVTNNATLFCGSDTRCSKGME